VPFLILGNQVNSDENAKRIPPGYAWDLARLFPIKYYGPAIIILCIALNYLGFFGFISEKLLLLLNWLI
jgi:hypothetical protein